ncbi:MAG: T9SS type A sorting domain-containing protein [bacterium]
MKFVKNLCLAVLFVTLVGVSTSNATTHIVEFGGAAGFNFVPKVTPSVMVGDTMQWVGSFNFHPLKFDRVPVGADTIVPPTTGMTFIYVVKVAGTYTFYCMQHGGVGGVGMSGSFTDAQVSVKTQNSGLLKMKTNYPNPFASSTNLAYSLAEPTVVSVRVLNVSGSTVYQENLGMQNSGDHSLELGNGAFGCNGTYIVELRAGEAVLTQRVVKAD